MAFETGFPFSEWRTSNGKRLIHLTRIFVSIKIVFISVCSTNLPFSPFHFILFIPIRKNYTFSPNFFGFFFSIFYFSIDEFTIFDNFFCLYNVHPDWYNICIIDVVQHESTGAQEQERAREMHFIHVARSFVGSLFRIRIHIYFSRIFGKISVFTIQRVIRITTSSVKGYTTAAAFTAIRVCSLLVPLLSFI